MSESAYYPLIVGGSGTDPFAFQRARKPQELAVVLKADADNPDEGDLYLTPAGEEWLVEPMDRSVAQRLKVRFSFWRGEWFLDLNSGTPYVQQILTKGVNDAVLRSIFGQIIQSTEGVAELQKFTYSINAQRVFTARFTAKLADDSVIDSLKYGSFSVSSSGPLSSADRSVLTFTG